jgi:hypothetical protein
MGEAGEVPVDFAVVATSQSKVNQRRTSPALSRNGKKILDLRF